MGAVSPDTLPIDNINPVMIFPKAAGKTMRLIVCNLVAPNAKLPSRYLCGTANNASSEVLIINGKTNKPRVKEPAKMESPKFNLLTNNAIPNNPKTIDGMLARLLVIILMILTRSEERRVGKECRYR